MKLENRHPPSSKLLAYLDLTKPRIIVMILVTTAFSFYLAARGFRPYDLLAAVLIGTAFLKGGAATLNQYLERDVDSLMERTRSRPLPVGIIQPQNALSFGLLLILIGVTILLIYVNLLTAFLGLLSVFLYVLIYTPAKRITWINTTIGAIPGALPAMGGWAAATGTLDWGAWIMFGIIFFWQHPHFYAIAMMCREDYDKAGFKMLPVVDRDGTRTIRHMVWHTLFLIPVSLMPTFLGLSGYVYLFGVLLLGVMYLLSTIPLAREYSAINAQKVLKASIIYLPTLLLLIVSDTAF